MGEGLNPVVSSERERPSAAAAVEPDPEKGGDVYQWAIDQAALIRAGRYGEIDWVNVADEIESVAKSEFRSLRSYVEIIIIHMLKWDHQPSRRSRSSMNSIEASRDHVIEELSDNPSLKARRDDTIETGYRLGRRAAARQTRIRLEVFPSTCPYDWDAIMTRPFVLDQTGGAP